MATSEGSGTRGETLVAVVYEEAVQAKGEPPRLARSTALVVANLSPSFLRDSRAWGRLVGMSLSARAGLAALTALTAFALGSTGCSRSPDATDGAKARARAACERDPAYAPREAQAAEKALDAYCAKSPCPGKEKLAAVCAFKTKDRPQSPPIYELMTTIGRGDTEREGALCKTVRASQAIASFDQLDLYCSNGKRCMTCGGNNR